MILRLGIQQDPTGLDIFSVGQPDSILTNTDPWFNSHFWQQLMKNIDIYQTMSTPYHHQTKKQVEQ